MKFSTLAVAIFACSVQFSANSAERPAHFSGEKVTNLSEALQNLSRDNNTLSSLINKPSLSLADMAQIHQLTYNLEVALQQVSRDLQQAALHLEEVHLGSEKAEQAKVLEQSQHYLNVMRQLVPASQ